jgi:hypothetical protein
LKPVDFFIAKRNSQEVELHDPMQFFGEHGEALSGIATFPYFPTCAASHNALQALELQRSGTR